MTNKITPEIIEKAVEWLDTQSFCCYALPSAMSGHPYDSRLCTEEDVDAAEVFLRPLLKRDNISLSGGWESSIDPHNPLSFTRTEWLLKIAQELREGKISA